MMALIGLARLIPAWAYGAVVVALLMSALVLHERSVGAAGVRAEWAAADVTARVDRADQIAKLEIKQAESSAKIQGKYDEEIASVRDALRAAGRMRLPAFCQPVAAPASAESAGSSITADPGSELLPESVDRSLKALIFQTEEVAATGRACQAFIRDNGMTP